MVKSTEKPGVSAIDHGRFGYARVSTRGQTLEAQLSALEAAEVVPGNVFAEMIGLVENVGSCSG